MKCIQLPVHHRTDRKHHVQPSRRVAVWLDHPTATAPRTALARSADRSARPRSPLSLCRAVLARDSRPVDHPRAEGVRRCARRNGGVAHLDLADVAAQIGVGHRGGRNSPLSRSIQRAIRFGAARSAGADSIEVRHRLAPLNRSQIERLPLALQAEHQHLHEQPVAAGPARSRARRLALSLIECGDGFAETERQLDQWRVPGRSRPRRSTGPGSAIESRPNTGPKRLRRHPQGCRLRLRSSGGPLGPSCSATGR